MALTPSTMLPLNTVLPGFDLPMPNGQRLDSSKLDDRPVVLMVICAHCPFVKHIEPELSRLEQDYGDRIQLIGISSNSLITHPQDGPEQLQHQAEIHGWSFPYLMDQDQTLAKALQAACTPEFYLFAGGASGDHTLRYRGQLDSSRPGNQQPLNGEDLRRAMDAVLVGQPVDAEQIASVGCNLKWHPGQEPAWFK
ncbi:thioredoxin family protein [Synechococcus sp. MIT S1220]|uniref:thioredoxin family protein n=1 Tax=Synechococcus sp. MIT S1220 TaxID=3082549 RepID=UPI0039B08070